MMHLMMMIYSKYLFDQMFVSFSNILFCFSFDLELENWGIDTWQLKEPVIMQKIKGWTEEWEKERNKKNDAVSKAMLVNKFKDTLFDLPDADNNNFQISKNEIEWTQGSDGGWTILGSVS